MSDGLKKISYSDFRKTCAKEQWEKYVEGVLAEIGDRDTYFLTEDGKLAFIAADLDGGGGSSHPVLVWSRADKAWMEE